MLDFAGSDAAHRAAGELLVGVVTAQWAVLSTEVAVSNLDTGVLKVGSGVSLEASVVWNVGLVAEAGEVVSEAFPHVLDRVNLNVFDPVVVLVLWVEPEGEPVRVWVTRHLVVELDLRDAVVSDEEVALAVRVLEDARVLVYGLASHMGRDGVAVLGDVWGLQELGSEPVSSTGTALVSIPPGIEHLGWIDSIPRMTIAVKLLELHASELLKLETVALLHEHHVLESSLQLLVLHDDLLWNSDTCWSGSLSS